MLGLCVGGPSFIKKNVGNLCAQHINEKKSLNPTCGVLSSPVLVGGGGCWRNAHSNVLRPSPPTISHSSQQTYYEWVCMPHVFHSHSRPHTILQEGKLPDQHPGRATEADRIQLHPRRIAQQPRRPRTPCVATQERIVHIPWMITIM